MSTRAATFLGYAVIFASIVMWAVVAARHRGWISLPDAWSAVTRTRAMRLALVVGWIWLGWHLFARGSGAFD